MYEKIGNIRRVRDVTIRMWGCALPPASCCATKRKNHIERRRTSGVNEKSIRKCAPCKQLRRGKEKSIYWGKHITTFLNLGMRYGLGNEISA